MTQHSSVLFYSAKKDQTFCFDNTKTKNMNCDAFAIQNIQNKPAFMYTYTKNDFAVHQISPYKKIRTTHHKNKPRGFCFSACGRFLFCLYNDKMQVYCKNKQVAEVKGEFYSYKVKQCGDKIVLTGNYNIIMYAANANEHAKTIYDLETNVADNLIFANVPRFYKKIRGDDIYIVDNVWIVSDSNQLQIYENEQEKHEITLPCVVKQIVAAKDKIYSLCENGKVYAAKKDSTTHDAVIVCDTKIQQICVTHCSTLLYVVTENELLAYFTKNDSIMDRFEIEDKVTLLGVYENPNETAQNDSFDIKI